MSADKEKVSETLNVVINANDKARRKDISAGKGSSNDTEEPTTSQQD